LTSQAATPPFEYLQVVLLKEVMTSLRKLNDKQALLASYQAQLLHMQRAGMLG
jgi:hypothetical protein